MADQIPDSAKSVPSSDLADILATIQNAADDWQKQGYPTALAEVRDMANVGRALMTAIADNAGSPPLKGWHPADCPSEIVSDLLNMLDDAIRAAPPAMDREAVKETLFLLDRLEEFEREITDDAVFTHFNGHVSPSAARVRMCLSTLSADAIRQGEGWQSIGTAPRDGSWFIADGGGLDRPTPMKWCQRVGAWEADAVMLEDWDNQAEGYCRPLFWLAIPDRLPATPASHASRPKL